MLQIGTSRQTREGRVDQGFPGPPALALAPWILRAGSFCFHRLILGYRVPWSHPGLSSSCNSPPAP